MRTPTIAAALLAAACCTAPAAAQQDIQLSFFPRPGQVVTGQSENRMAIEVDVTGEQLRERSRAAGARLPLRVQHTDRQRTRTSTGPAAADGSFPLTLEFLEAESRTVDADNQPLPGAAARPALAGTKVQAHVVPPRDIVFVAAQGPSIDPRTAAVLPQMVQGIFRAMEQLEAVTVRVGETATQTVNLPVPMPGGLPPMQVVAKVVYTLRELQGDVGRFGIAMEYALSQPDGGSVRVQAQGTGQGTMEYDGARALMTRMDTESDLVFRMEVPGGAFLQKLHLQQAVSQAPGPRTP